MYDRDKAAECVNLIIEKLNSKYTGRGGKSALAWELGYSKQAFYSVFTKKKLVPEHKVSRLVELARELKIKNENGKYLKKSDFRPDLF